MLPLWLARCPRPHLPLQVVAHCICIIASVSLYYVSTTISSFLPSSPLPPICPGAQPISLPFPPALPAGVRSARVSDG
ncbi:hypothetical protein L226DRAFT_529004 [Lentinus tigrinus ALCF2SS1-7]|uniref:uncharacterized protein n=1 Tax=Lentinus tigrinus ALCF2SS1-7 TaxID=1328758 RepID=UPI0011660360|nr:hypothetical protein L226DRAFT_529004 [Lentinus tigrinus ALCF2SS1-7]